MPYGHLLRPVRHGDLARLLVADPDLDERHGRRRIAAWCAEMRLGRATTYVLVDEDETALLGTVRVTADGVSSWIVEECRGTDLERAVADTLSRWTTRSGTP